MYCFTTREYWMIFRCRMIRLLPNHLSASCLSFLSFPMCHRPSLVTREGGRRGRSQIIRHRESLALYKSFNIYTSLLRKMQFALWSPRSRLSKYSRTQSTRKKLLKGKITGFAHAKNVSVWAWIGLCEQIKGNFYYINTVLITRLFLDEDFGSGKLIYSVL